ncbi:MAG: MFS transporter [Promethearchaeota archaeon]
MIKTTDQLTKKQQLLYSLGAVPGALLGFIFTLKYVEFFYNDLKLLPIYFIIGQVIYMTVNALNDPLLGQLSDRTNREKWGSRRIIYIKYGGPIWALTFILIWIPWSYNNQFIIFLHYVISICLFDTMLTLVILTWMALLPEMTSDIDERNKINFFILLIGLFAVAPFMVLIAEMKTTSNSFRMLMIIIAIISTICLLIVAYTAEEKPEFQKDEVFPLIQSIKETLKSKSFLIFIGYNFCMIFMGSLILSYLFIYILILGPDPQFALGFFFLVYLIVGYGSSIYCMKLRPKWGMRKIILRFGLLRVIGTLIIFILILFSSSYLLIMIGFLWITFFGGYGVFTTSLMYLSIDEDELNHGIRREGMFLGTNALLTKPASSLGPIFATIILVAFNYVQKGDASDQPPEALFGIKILFLLIPAIITLISLIFMYFYPLYGEKLNDMKLKLEKLHIEKKEKLKNQKNK